MVKVSASRVGPVVKVSASRVGPVVKVSASRVGPVVKVSASRVGPVVKVSASRVGPVVKMSASRVGPVVKVSASRAGDPEFDSPLRRVDFSRSSQTSDCPARRLALQGQHWDWSARCRYTVAARGRKFDLQLLSQCGR